MKKAKKSIQNIDQTTIPPEVAVLKPAEAKRSRRQENAQSGILPPWDALSAELGDHPLLYCGHNLNPATGTTCSQATLKLLEEYIADVATYGGIASLSALEHLEAEQPAIAELLNLPHHSQEELLKHTFGLFYVVIRRKYPKLKRISRGTLRRVAGHVSKAFKASKICLCKFDPLFVRVSAGIVKNFIEQGHCSPVEGKGILLIFIIAFEALSQAYNSQSGGGHGAGQEASSEQGGIFI